MIPVYEENQDALEIKEIRSNHFPPHLHSSVELILVTKGTLVLGIDTNLTGLAEGDLGIVFPNQIHHFQVFDAGECRAVHLLFAPSYFGRFSDLMTSRMPADPVIRAEEVREDTRSGFTKLLAAEKLRKKTRSDSLTASVRRHARVQLILADLFDQVTLTDRPDLHEFDIVYQAVSYVAKHFREEISLDRMAADLGVSKYTLSRLFSRTFHVNFPGFVNDYRLGYAVERLRETDEPVTDIIYDSGFQSQTTFNRAFRNKFRMSPKAFRDAAVHAEDDDRDSPSDVDDAVRDAPSR